MKVDRKTTVWKESAECALGLCSFTPGSGTRGSRSRAQPRPARRTHRTAQELRHTGGDGPRQAERVIRPKNNMSVYKSTRPRDSLFRGCCRGVLTHCLHRVRDRRNLGTNDGLNHLSALRDERSKTPWMWQGGMMAGAGMAAVAHLVKHERGA